MVFENGVKNIQAAAYNGARTIVGLKFNRKLKKISSLIAGGIHNVLDH
jgi:hypothetical protein